MGTSTSSQNHDSDNIMSDLEGHGRDRLLDHDHSNNGNNGYIVNCIHEDRPLSLNDIARPVFVNHYYAAELLLPVTSKKLIRLDECDVSTENSMRNLQPQGTSCESREALRDSLRMQMVSEKDVGSIPTENILGQGHNRGFHSEFVEPSQHSLGTLNIGKLSRTRYYSKCQSLSGDDKSPEKERL